MQANRFLFDRDFRDGRGDAKRAAEIAAAEERGHARGFGEGRRLAEEQASARLAASMHRLAEAAAQLLAAQDGERRRIEAEAVELALALARKLAGEALTAQPLAGIAAAAGAALAHLRAAPHLAARVHPALVEEAETLLRRLAEERGFAGRLVVLGDPDIAPGDARIEWADGGIVLERARIEASADQALAGFRTDAAGAALG